MNFLVCNKTRSGSVGSYCLFKFFLFSLSAKAARSSAGKRISNAERTPCKRDFRTFRTRKFRLPSKPVFPKNSCSRS